MFSSRDWAPSVHRLIHFRCDGWRSIVVVEFLSFRNLLCQHESCSGGILCPMKVRASDIPNENNAAFFE
jgi:hypothetical protein